MQARMKHHQLEISQINALLHHAQVGHFATISPMGYPYVLPVHFVYYKSMIYIHGLPQGQKIDYLTQNPKVGFEVDEMVGLIYGAELAACDINTEYSSVIIQGRARVLTDRVKQHQVLHQIVAKYAPDYSSQPLPAPMVAGTAIIEITIDSCTGKYYK